MNLTQFDYQKSNNFNIKLIKTGKKYNLFRIEFPSAYRVGIPVCDKVTACYYRSANPKKAIIIIHGISMVWATSYFCRILAKKGFSCLMPIMPYAPARIPRKRPLTKIPENMNWPEIFKRGLIQSVIDVRKSIDFLEKENDMIGIIGISLGANIAALVKSIDDRIISGVFLVGGADLANTLWDSRDFIARIYKQKLFRCIDRQELALKWKQIDVLTYAKESSNILMINAKYDTSVRPIYTIKLWEALGKPEIHWLRCAHFFIIHIFFIKNLVLRHFRKTLN